jgi:hypothetical protein
MKWPWSREPVLPRVPPRPTEIVVRHDIPALSELADALRYAARRNKEAAIAVARLGRPDIVRAKAPKSENPDPPEWVSWEAAHMDIDENERLDLKWSFDVLTGREKADETKRQRAILLYAAAQELYDLPRIDARASVLPQSPDPE